jgi:hypothetical protein
MISQHPTESEEFEAIVARSFEPTMELPVLPATSTWTDLTVVAQADHGPKPSLIHRPAAALEQARQRRQQSATAKGEARVAYQLGRLPQGWHVMHPVPVGQRADDRVHLVIGPGGVFTLDTKFHPSSKVWSNGEALWVNGRRTHELASSRYAATRASAVLGEAVGFAVPVESVVVMVGSGLTKAGEPDGVHLVYLELLVRWFKGRPAVLSDDTVALIVDQARRSTTWHA